MRTGDGQEVILRSIIVFIESDSQIPFLEEWINTHGPEMSATLIIALTPEAGMMLSEKSIPYENTVKYFGRAGHEKTLHHSGQVMRWLRNNVSLEDNFGNAAGYRHYILFNLRFFLHYLFFVLEVIHKAVQEHQPEKILVPQISEKCGRQVNYATYPSQLADLAESYCKANGLNFKRSEALMEEDIKPYISVCFRIRGQIAGWVHPAVCSIHGRLSRRKSKLLISERSNNMAAFIETLAGKYTSVCPAYLVGSNKLLEILRGIFGKSAFNYYLPERLPEKKTRQWQDTVAGFLKELSMRSSRDSDMLKFNNTCIDEILSDFLFQTLPDQLLWLYCKAYGLEQIFKKAKPDLVISQLAYGQTYLMGETAARYDVPSVLISHGSHTPPRSEFSRIEWEEHGRGMMDTVYRFQAIQTPLAEQYLEEIPSHSEPWKTGPVLFARKGSADNISLIRREEILPGVRQKNILMHAGTAKTIRDLRLFVYETNDEYIENLNHLIAEVEQLEDTYLVVRFRPNWQLTVDTFKKLLRPGRNYGVYCSGSFQDYLAVTDLLISYSSTTIEEALQNEIPVLQYDPQGKYCHVEGQALESNSPCRPNTCYFVGARADLGSGLRWILKNHLEHHPKPDIDWGRHRFHPSDIVPIDKCVGPFLNKSMREASRG